MKNHRNKASLPAKKTQSGTKVTPAVSRGHARRSNDSQPGPVRRTPDGTAEENSEEAAP